MAQPNASEPLESLQQCTEWVLSGARQPADFHIGTEFERIALGPDGRPLPYEGKDASISAVLADLSRLYGWEPYQEKGRTIALFRDGASISLEPAGQLELSGGLQATVADMQRELHDHMAELQSVLEPRGISLVHVGLNPQDSPASAPKMPKGRYGVMRAYMPKVGSLGLHMMHLTCTVQTNFDFVDAADAAQAMRLGHLLTPALIALFANSPLLEGRDTGYASFRAHIWTDVDKDRCDTNHFSFRPDATVQDYVDWLIDVPLYFLDALNDDGSHGYRELPERTTFRQFFDHGALGRRPTLDDWVLHVSTVFPDVRLKRYLELRPCDLVPEEALAALPALTRGLFYDLEARKKALELLEDGNMSIDRPALRAQACLNGLAGVSQGRSIGEIAKEVLDIATQGLDRLAKAEGRDALAYRALDPLKAIAHGKEQSYSQRVLRKWQADPRLAALADPWPKAK